MQHGVYVDINEKIKAPDDAESDGGRWILNPLAERWDAMMKFAEEAAEHLLRDLWRNNA